MFNFFKKKKESTETNQETKVVYQEDYNDIEPISKYFQNETGVTFDKQESILKNKVMSFCRQREIYSFSKLLQEVKTNQKIKQELIDHLTTNETFFNREIKQIDELVSLVKGSHTKVDILCAPCATGEEPYSIAIALLEAGVESSSFNIVGIDINADAISKAEIAVYKERNVRKLSPNIISNYFEEDKNRYFLKTEVKSLVSFKVYNLFDDSFKSLGKFDFVFSRNMLIYFNYETKIKAKSILENMRKNEQHDVFFGHADLF